MAAPTGTGFVNLDRYMAANQNDINATANTLAGQDTQAAQAAKNEDDRVGQSAYDQAKAQGSEKTFDPTSVADYATAQSDSQNAYSNLQGLTDGPNSNLQVQLQDTYGKRGAYGAGDSGFDAALLGSSASAQNTFQNAQNGFQNLGNYAHDTVNNQMAAGNAQYGQGVTPARGPAGFEPGSLTPGTVKNDPFGAPQPGIRSPRQGYSGGF